MFQKECVQFIQDQAKPREKFVILIWCESILTSILSVAKQS